MTAPEAVREHEQTGNRTSKAPQYLGPWSGVQVQAIESDKGVRRGPSCHSTNIFKGDTPGQGTGRGDTPSGGINEACKSLTLLREAKARSRADFRVRNFSEADSMGPQRGPRKEGMVYRKASAA
ncbi:hypothetical protein Q7C36_009927 [Tachysurus vachellii]|uniref:Uncharacterized protein n=1 Tax=Tachysurus vachellii TaxID=175792 RepID=A0AA88N3G1_TACVA|nr:hypothetical protein Q7C36_009927 [Tachysurus vachellii]